MFLASFRQPREQYTQSNFRKIRPSKFPFYLTIPLEFPKFSLECFASRNQQVRYFPKIYY